MANDLICATPSPAVSEEMVDAAIAAWNEAPLINRHGHMIANRFERDQMRAALLAAMGEG